MAPSVWGPMAWRMLHGLAHRFDTMEGTVLSADVMEAVVLLLLRLSWVLPCVHCRNSYTEYLIDNREAIDELLLRREMRTLVWHLHNLVNLKLDKPQFERLDVVKRRSEVWSVEFDAREVLGLLFVVALNYDTNGEPDRERNYHAFFAVLPPVLHFAGEPLLASALARYVARMPPHITQNDLVARLYRAQSEAWRSVCWGPIPSRVEIEDRYNLCRSDAVAPR
jgi:hypothetical protein